MPLQTLIDRKMTYCLVTTTVAQVAQAMAEDDADAVLVVSHGAPRGIITERHIVRRCVLEGRDPQETTAETILSDDVGQVRWDQDLDDIARVMRNEGVRHVAIVDAGGNALGLASFDDVFDRLSAELSLLRGAVRNSHRPKSQAA
jgi:CBS domain-containing protein